VSGVSSIQKLGEKTGKGTKEVETSVRLLGEKEVGTLADTPSRGGEEKAFVFRGRIGGKFCVGGGSCRGRGARRSKRERGGETHAPTNHTTMGEDTNDFAASLTVERNGGNLECSPLKSESHCKEYTAQRAREYAKKVNRRRRDSVAVGKSVTVGVKTGGM